MNPNEQIMDYISRLILTWWKCEFSDSERNEPLVEMIIVYTPYGDFRKELLVKEKRFDIIKVAERGREYEAILASQKSLSNLKPHIHNQQISTIKKSKCCRNCRNHQSKLRLPNYHIAKQVSQQTIPKTSEIKEN